MGDVYKSFGKLAESEREGSDYSLEWEDRKTDIAVVAPHGGGIEQGTSEIAEAVAGEQLSYYCFNGIKARGNRDLHITSTQFDEPKGLALVQRSHTVVAMHGLEGEDEVVKVGGLAEELKERLLEALTNAGFKATRDRSHHSGTFSSNLCNSGVTSKGVQLEISRGLRLTMFKSLDRRGRRFKTTRFQEFVRVIRDVLLSTH